MKKSDIILFSTLTALALSGLVYYNFIDKTPSKVTGGNEVGDICFNQDIKLINGETGTWSVNDNIGKVSVINFWGTWCTPCVAELPGFNAVYQKYKDTTSFIAIHQKGYEQEEVEAFIDEREGWKDFTINFGLDDSKNEYYTRMGGKKVWPMTIIIDKEGVITFKRQGKLDEASLEQEIINALNKEKGD